MNARVLAVAIALAACGGPQPVAPAPAPLDAAAVAELSFDQRLIVVGEFRDRMCACKDSACAEHVATELHDWKQSHADLGRTATDEEQRRAMAVGTELLDCLRRATGAPP